MPKTGLVETISNRKTGKTLIFACNCDGWRRGHTTEFDSQDAQQQGWIACPCCKKAFKVEGEVEGEALKTYEREGDGDGPVSQQDTGLKNPPEFKGPHPEST